MKNQRRKKLP